MKTYIELRDTGTYAEWRTYLITKNGDLRALTAAIADRLQERAFAVMDQEMIEALETFFG